MYTYLYLTGNNSCIQIWTCTLQFTDCPSFTLLDKQSLWNAAASHAVCHVFLRMEGRKNHLSKVPLGKRLCLWWTLTFLSPGVNCSYYLNAIANEQLWKREPWCDHKSGSRLHIIIMQQPLALITALIFCIPSTPLSLCNSKFGHPLEYIQLAIGG